MKKLCVVQTKSEGIKRPLIKNNQWSLSQSSCDIATVLVNKKNIKRRSFWQ